MTRIPAIYRDGKFVPSIDVPLKDETAVELLLVDDNLQQPHPDAGVRAAARRRAVELMQRHHLSMDMPSFTRDELHERH